MIYKEFPVPVDILWIGRLRVRRCPRRAHRQPGDKAVATGVHAARGRGGSALAAQWGVLLARVG